jgi:hypothetical protein
MQRQSFRAHLTHSHAMTVTSTLDHEHGRSRLRALRSRERHQRGEEGCGSTPAHYFQGNQ